MVAHQSLETLANVGMLQFTLHSYELRFSLNMITLVQYIDGQLIRHPLNPLADMLT